MDQEEVALGHPGECDKVGEEKSGGYRGQPDGEGVCVLGNGGLQNGGCGQQQHPLEAGKGVRSDMLGTGG